MVSSNHEAMHRLFQHDPGVFARATRALGLSFPDPISVEILTTDATEIKPLERRIDTVLRITTSEGAYVLPIEAQGRKDQDKESTWPYCVAHLRAKYGLPVVLLVVCQDEATAIWANGPFSTGHSQWTSQITYPLVLGPKNVPAITDPETAVKDIPLATLSAIAHAKDKAINAILDALAAALKMVDADNREHFAVYTELGLGTTPAADYWRKLVTADTSFYRSETFQRVRAESRAEDILRLLELRNIAVPEDVRTRIITCTDPDQLSLWFDRAANATGINDLFA